METSGCISSQKLSVSCFSFSVCGAMMYCRAVFSRGAISEVCAEVLSKLMTLTSALHFSPASILFCNQGWSSESFQDNFMESNLKIINKPIFKPQNSQPVVMIIFSLFLIFNWGRIGKPDVVW